MEDFELENLKNYLRGARENLAYNGGESIPDILENIFIILDHLLEQVEVRQN